MELSTVQKNLVKMGGEDKGGGGEAKGTDWMYNPNGDVNKEEYLLGKAVGKNFDSEGTMGKINDVEYDCTPGSIFASRANHQVDLQRKLMEDPLVSIKKREMEDRRKILDNPVKMKALKEHIDELKQKTKSKKDKKKKKKKKKSKGSDDDSDDDLDLKLLKKIQKMENDDGGNESSDGQDGDSVEMPDKARKIAAPVVKEERRDESPRPRNRRERKFTPSASPPRRRVSPAPPRQRKRSPSTPPRRRRSPSSPPRRRRSNSGPRRRSPRRRSPSLSPARVKRSSSCSPPAPRRRKRSPSTTPPRRKKRSPSRSPPRRKNRSSSRSPPKRENRSRSRSAPRRKHSPAGSPLPLRKKAGLDLMGKNPRQSSPQRKAPVKMDVGRKEVGKKSGVSAEEKQARLAEMMANAEWRDEQRTCRVKRQRASQEREDEEAKREHDPNFKLRELKRVQDNQTVEGRITTNKYRIQRGHGDMDKNFARR